MSDFIAYKPMDVEHNVKAAVENLRKAYWNNETEKVGRFYIEAEGIIISALVHDNYTVCKAYGDSGDCISRSALREESQTICKDCNIKTLKPELCKSCFMADYLKLIDNAQAVEPRTEYGTDGQPYKLTMTNGKEYERPQGEWEDYSADFYKCPECGYLLNKLCPKCHNEVILPKGGAE